MNNTSETITELPCNEKHVNFEKLLDFLHTYYQMFLIIVGCMGNSMTIIIFWRTKLAHSSRTSFYLISLAVSDNAMLANILLTWLDKKGILPDAMSINKVSWVCKFSNYIGYVINFVSCGLVVAFTVQRLCSICFPFRVNRHNLESKSKFVVLLLFLSGCVIYSYQLYIQDIRYDEIKSYTNDTLSENVSYCWAKKNYGDQAEKFAIYDSLITLIFPFLGLLIMNAMIIQTLKSSNYNFAYRASAAIKKSPCQHKSSQIIKSEPLKNSENSKGYVMCKCHQDHFRKSPDLPTIKATEPTNSNKDKKKNLIAFYRASKSRRSSVEIHVAKKTSKSSKRYLASFKLDKFNKLQQKEFIEKEPEQIKDHISSENATKCQCSGMRRFRSNFKKKNLPENDNEKPESKSLRKNSSLLLREHNMSYRISGRNYHSVSRKITKMLIIVSTVFLVLNLPLHAFQLYTFLVMRLRSKENQKYYCYEHYIKDICYHIFFTSFSCNFLLYSISGVKFRNEIKKLIYKIFRIKPQI